MGRTRIYASAADRQRAHRARVAATRQPSPSTAPSLPRQRPRYRPARLLALCRETEQLRDEYQAWLDNLPENLQDGPQAERLAETIESLESIIALFEEVELPRGFGRD